MRRRRGLSAGSDLLNCPSCANPVPGGARYCIRCGARVAGDAPTPAPPSLTERKFVSIMFIDMVGSLDAIRDKDPEDAHELLSSAMSVMRRAVHAYGGVVAETRGDGILAIFGAPQAQEDHAVRACHAALWLQSLLAHGLADRIALRVGINSGEVAVGSVPNDFTSDYTATGAVVHIAARVQAVAQPNETVLTADTAALVREVMRTGSLGPRTVKGLDAPIELHRLVGLRTAHDAAPPHASRRFVGRTAELAELDAAFAAARAGRGGVVGVTGEAGIGKTSVVERLAQAHPGAELIRGSVEYHTGAAPLRPFAELLSQLLGLANVPPAQRRLDLGVRLDALGLDRPACEPPLLDLLADDGGALLGIAPRLRNELIDTAVVQVLLAASRQRELLIVLEDLHRADSATVELVARLVPAVGASPLLFITSFRPEFRAPWAGHTNYHEIQLERLSDDDTRALITESLGKAAPAEVERRLARWSKGNPLFVQESVRAMAEAGAVEDPESDAWTGVPPSIGAVVAARVDRLDPVAKRALLSASVFGEHFTRAALADVCAVVDEALAEPLAALVAAGFIRPLDAAQRSYGFQHELFQEVCYGTLLRRQRRGLHHAAYTALRRSGAAPPVENLARHAYAGELWNEAVVVCREAGQRAALRYANREAALHLENAIDALGRADPDAGRFDDAIALRLELRSVSLPLLRLDRIDTLLAEANELAERSGDPSQRARLTSFRAGHAYLTRNPTLCIELCGQALQLADVAAEARLRIAPTLYLAQAQYALGRYRQVVTALEHDRLLQDPDLSGAEVGLPARPVVIRGYWLAISQAERGRFDAARALAGEMIEHADARQPFESLYAQTALGFILLLRGELAAALQASEVALAIAERNDVPFLAPVLNSQVGLLLATQGRTREGLEMARRAMRKVEAIGSNAGSSRWCARLAETCLLAGELDDARRQAETAVDFAQGRGELGYLCSALRLRAKVQVAEDRLDAAASDLLLATSVARTLRLGPALAKCYFDVGALGHRAGRIAEAQRAFQLARKGFVRYGMGSGAARAEVALAQLDAGAPAPSAEAFFGSAE